ncbi:MAG: ankyrin repeat domain-containing protein [Pirellulales bacterium]
MSQSNRPVPDDIARLHRAAANGDLERVRAALTAGIDVDSPGHCGVTALMVALQARHLPIAKLLIEQGADPELTDDFNSTALKHAVEADFADGVRVLLSLGVDRGYEPRYPLKRRDYCPLQLPMPDDFAGMDSGRNGSRASARSPR